MASPIDSLTIGVRCSGPGGAVNPKLSKTKYNIVALTSGNFTSQHAKADALELATEALTLGVVATESITNDKPINSGYPASSANRSAKWILTAVNPNSKKSTYTIPAPLTTGNLLADGETANIDPTGGGGGSTAWNAYQTAFNAVATDTAALALSLISGKLGGRRA
ncbi:MAG: hypothetical protein ACJ8BW_40565 [Ktedonobacteraceae bacterium]